MPDPVWSIKESTLTGIGNAIRARTGGSALIDPDDMPTQIAAIPGPKVEQSKTAYPTGSDQTVSPDTGKVLSSVKVKKVTTTNLTSENVRDGVTVKVGNENDDDAVIGLVGSLVPAKTEQSKTVTPTAAGFTVTPDSGKVLSSVVVNGDADLVAGNVKKDVNIFGVVGTYEGEVSQHGVKFFSYTSAEAVGNQTIKVVEADPDVAAHYADAKAFCVIRKITGLDTRGLAFICNGNIPFSGSENQYGSYVNFTGAANGALSTNRRFDTATTTGYGFCYGTSTGDIYVRCGSTNNNFGGATYDIMFVW